MFKGIVTARREAEQKALESLTPEVILGQALDAVAGLEELYAADVQEAERQETLKNARALRTALEQFGTDATATRALLAFADADGQLSAAFGVEKKASLESVDDTQILQDAAAIAGGLESYILGEEQDEVSVERLIDWVRRHKILTGVLITLFAPFGLLIGAPSMIALKVMDDNAPVPASFYEVKDAFAKIGKQLEALSKVASMSPSSATKESLSAIVERLPEPEFVATKFAAAGWNNDSIKEIVALTNKMYAEAKSVLGTVDGKMDALAKDKSPGAKLIVDALFSIEKVIRASATKTRFIVKTIATKCYSKSKPKVED